MVVWPPPPVEHIAGAGAKLVLSSNVAAESKIKPLKYSYCNFIGLKPPANLQVLIKQ